MAQSELPWTGTGTGTGTAQPEDYDVSQRTEVAKLRKHAVASAASSS